MNQENRPFDVNFDENDELKASVKYSVTIDGEKNYFFPTMDDPQAALAWLKKAAPNVLQALSEEYDLDEITCDNWEQYRDSLFVLLDKDGAPDWYHEEEGYEEFMKVEGLFDILENDVLNEELLEYLDSIEGSLTVEDKEALAVHFLPYTAPLSEKRTGPMTFEE